MFTDKQMRSYQTTLQKAWVVLVGFPLVTMHIPTNRAQAATNVLTAMLKFASQSRQECVDGPAVAVLYEHCTTRGKPWRPLACHVDPWRSDLRDTLAWSTWNLSHRQGWIPSRSLWELRQNPIHVCIFRHKYCHQPIFCYLHVLLSSGPKFINLSDFNQNF